MQALKFLSIPKHFLIDFTVRTNVDIAPQRYELFIELEEPKKLRLINEAFQISQAGFAESFDFYLRLNNPIYNEKREVKKIGSAAVHFVKNGAFALLRELCLSTGTTSVQYKVNFIGT